MRVLLHAVICCLSNNSLLRGLVHQYQAVNCRSNTFFWLSLYGLLLLIIFLPFATAAESQNADAFESLLSQDQLTSLEGNSTAISLAFDHVGITSDCTNCHGSTANGKPDTHIATDGDCIACHLLMT